MPKKIKLQNQNTETTPVDLSAETSVIRLPQKSWLKWAVLFAILGIVLLALAGEFFWRNRKLNNKLRALQNQNRGTKQSTVAAENGNKELLSAVSKLIVLPQNEQPTVATVQDLSKLQGQPFFVQAQVGDKVLIYAQAKKAILYRPNENKIVEVAPINTASATTTATSSQMSLEIRNGSGVSGAAANWKEKLKGESGMNVISTGNTTAVYQNTLLYVPEERKASVAVLRLRQLTGANIITVLPENEPISQAGAILILGKE